MTIVDTDPNAISPDDQPGNEVCMETLPTCGVVNHGGHKCGELANHEATGNPHICGLPDDGLDANPEFVTPEELAVCRYEWFAGEETNAEN